MPTTGSLREAIDYVRRRHSRLRTGVGYSFAVADAATDDAVGKIGLWLRDIREGRATTGYWMGPEPVALGVLTDWALQLFVEPWNDCSSRAAERCGFECEGLLRSWQLVGSARR